MGPKNQSFKHVCKTCGYSTNRLSNFKDHLNRKNPCKPKQNESTNFPSAKMTMEGCQNDKPLVKMTMEGCQNDKPLVKMTMEDGQNDNVKTLEKMPMDDERKCLQFKCVKCDKELSSKRSLMRHQNVCNGVHSLQCPICLKVFSHRNAKNHHMKTIVCRPSAIEAQNPQTDMDSKTEIERLQAEIEKLKLNQSVINNTYNITTTNNNSTTNNNHVINLNNFDSPSLSHITPQMIGEMYLKSDRELPRMIGHAVRKIYKEHPENDTIRFKYGNQAGFAEVRQDDETRILPVSDVLETVLSKTSTLCGKELQKCCGPNMIPGPGVVHDAQELSVLHWGFVPETHAKRQGFFKFVKSALL